jgi:signal transduction histidine kinase
VSPRRPLDTVRSLKIKLGAVIFSAVAVTVFVYWLCLKAGVWPSVSGIIAGSLALVMVRFLARCMTSPLREMADAARAMAKGNYDRRVSATSRDEVGELARAFNKMAAELAETDRLRRDLVANVSHELRTPITALQAVLENLVDGVESPDPQTFRTMLAQVERLGRLVTQLLDLSRLESGAVPLERSEFAVAPVLDHAVREQQLHAPGVDVRVLVETPGLTADGDPERVHQVVANLLENAVRYTPSGGRVEVRARRASDGQRAGVTIEVCDEGPGIAEGQEARVFERFYRADTARASSDGGAGLGLAIAQWIVDLHGGDIRPERREPHGCRMVVTLPRGAAQPERVHS